MANIVNGLGQTKVGVKLTPPPTSSLLTNLYSSWNADNNLLDSFGTNHGTGIGGLTYTPGKIGQAFTFNETNSYVRLPNNSLNFTDDFSFSFWVYTNISFRVQFFFNSYSYTSGNTYGHGYYCYMDNGSLSFTIIRGNDAPANYSVGHSWTQNWHHVVVTRKKSTSTKIYINGVLKSGSYNIGNATINPVYQANQISNLGGVNNGTVNLLNGKMDLINAWNKELNQTEVTELYNSGNGKQYPF